MKTQTFWEHCEELRLTLIKVGGIILIGILASLFISKPLLEFLLTPLEKQKTGIHRTLVQREWIENKNSEECFFSLPPNAKAIFPLDDNVKQLSSEMFVLQPNGILTIETSKRSFILTTPLEGFLTTFKVAFFCGFILTSPVWLGVFFRFFLPALRTHEMRLFFPFILLSLIFVGLGVFFAFKVTLPLVSIFFRQFGEGLGENLWSLNHCLDFVLCLLVAHALAFECFAMLFLLVHLNVLTGDMLKKARRYVIVAIFIAAAILTPPDVLSQLLLAFPLIMLYEGVILYSLWKNKKRSLA